MHFSGQRKICRSASTDDDSGATLDKPVYLV